MCGIAGWVDYARDLTREREALMKMTRTMERRGPDAEGLWIAPHAGLGHRRLSIIDLEGGRQPMIAGGDGAPTAVLVYTGEVYNFLELREELSARGRVFQTRSDTEVVLEAYLTWGDAFVERLNGMYAFALWDVAKEELLLVRDRMGIKPLYYQPTPTGVLFGSEPKAILEAPGMKASVDADGLREIFSFVKTPGITVFRGMHEVRPGHVVHIRREGVRERRYWALEARPHTDDLKTTIASIRGLLEDTIERQLISDVPLCTLLSGGLDSSVVTALSQRALKAHGGGSVRSFSVDFVGQTERFKPDLMRATPDAPYVAEVAKFVGSDHRDIVLSAAELADPTVRAAVLRARDIPAGFGDLDASLYLLFKAIREHSTVALSGESADEVFGGYLWFHDPEAIAAETFPWLAMRQRWVTAEMFATLFDPAFMAKLDVGHYVERRYREALAEVPHLPDVTGHERRMREICYLNLTRFLTMLLDRKDRMSMASGLEVRVPFCDHRLVQYVFNTPWAMKSFDGREKSLLRAAARDLLPQSVLERRKSPYPSTQDPAYGDALRRKLAEVVADREAPVQHLLNKESARALVNEPNKITDDRSRMPMEQVLVLNDWMKRYEVELDL